MRLALDVDGYHRMRVMDPSSGSAFDEWLAAEGLVWVTEIIFTGEGEAVVTMNARDPERPTCPLVRDGELVQVTDTVALRRVPPVDPKWLRR